MRFAIVSPLLLAAILWCRSSAAEPPPAERPSERWDRAVCLVEEGGHVASRPSQLEASWGQEEILFTYPVVGAGCSGGPVFLNQQDPAEATVVGMCIGLYQDKHGFKLNKVVPAHLLLAFLRQQDNDGRERDTGG